MWMGNFSNVAALSTQINAMNSQLGKNGAMFSDKIEKSPPRGPLFIYFPRKTNSERKLKGPFENLLLNFKG